MTSYGIILSGFCITLLYLARVLLKTGLSRLKTAFSLFVSTSIIASSLFGAYTVHASEVAIATTTTSDHVVELIKEVSLRESLSNVLTTTIEELDKRVVEMEVPQEEITPVQETVVEEKSPQVQKASIEQTSSSSTINFGSSKHETGSKTAHDDGSANEWEPGYYVAHSGSAQGQLISSLSIGDVVEVDGRAVTITGSMNGYAGQSYEEIRSITGWDTVCFQTCTDEYGNDVIYYGTVAGGADFTGGVVNDYGQEWSKAGSDYIWEEYTYLMNQRDYLTSWQAELIQGTRTDNEAYEQAVAEYESRVARYEAIA